MWSWTLSSPSTVRLWPAGQADGSAVRVAVDSQEAASTIINELDQAVSAGRMSLEHSVALYELAGQSLQPAGNLCAAQCYLAILQDKLRRTETSPAQVGRPTGLG